MDVKLFLVDTGIACHLTGIENESALRPHRQAGNLLEDFGVCEIITQLTWTDYRARCYHFRSHSGREVDLILEDAAGRMVGLEM